MDAWGEGLAAPAGAATGNEPNVKQRATTRITLLILQVKRDIPSFVTWLKTVRMFNCFSQVIREILIALHPSN